MKRNSAWLALGVALLILTSGCAYTKVVPLDSQMTFNFRLDSTLGERKNYTAVMMPFTDGREDNYRTNKWGNFPALGLFLEFISTTRHTMPEVTFNHYPDVIGNQTGGEALYIKGDFAASIPQAMAKGLQEAGVFKEVRYAEKLDENFDMRDYDYIIRGRVLQTDLKVTDMTYGLRIIPGILDASWFIKLLAAPDMILSAVVQYEVEILERQTGKSVWSGKVEYPKQGQWVGYYYGRRLEGVSPNTGLFTRIFKEQLSGTVSRIKKEIQY